MPEPDTKQSFWTTLPGVLTGVAALLTAVTGLLVVMHPRDGSAAKDGTAAISAKDAAIVASGSSPVSGDAAPAVSNAAKGAGSVMPRQDKPTVLLTRKDGAATRGFLHGFEDSQSLQAIALKDGQSIPFDKIRSVDFAETHGSDQDVRVTLTDGRTLEGDILAGEQMTGETDIGPFSISVKDLKQIVFER